METIKVKLLPKAILPAKSTEGSSGYDLFAYENGIIAPGERRLVPTGVYLEIPLSYEAQIRPRSGLASKKGVTVINTPGTIDSDYRGHVQVCLINHGTDPFEYAKGETAIAQMVFAKVESPVLVADGLPLSDSKRGEGGFGHTGNF